MPILNRKINLLALCLVLSVAVHSLALCAVRMFGSYRFGAAVGEAPVVVSLADLRATPAAGESTSRNGGEEISKREAPAETDQKGARPVATVAAARQSQEAPAADQDGAEKLQPEPQPAEPPSPAAAASAAETSRPAAETSKVPQEASPAAAANAAQGASTGSPPRNGAFPAAKEEKLTYLISMMGLPIGNAELEAKNNERGTTLTLRVRSNPAMSSVFPVDNLVETQQVDGRYLMTRVQQHEGNFRSDEGFSINLPQKRVSWSDNLNYRNHKMNVPTEDVLDTLSGIYSLRHRALQVGKTEILHIFDSETYAEVPVEVLRREETRLPNLTKVDALVVRPLQKTAGIFRRTGDILIWMTDDANKIPVKIVTTIALGKVTAELVSAESQTHDAAAKGKVD